VVSSLENKTRTIASGQSHVNLDTALMAQNQIKYSSGCTNKQCSELRVGHFLAIAKSSSAGKFHTCKITDISSSKTGKHGGLKVHISCKDVFDGKNKETIFSSVDMVEVPNTSSENYQVSLIDEEDSNYVVSLFLHNGETAEILMGKTDEKAPEIFEKFEGLSDKETLWITVFSAGGEGKIIDYKVQQDKGK